MSRFISALRSITVTGFLVVSIVLLGCGKKGGPKLYPVEGKITYKGNPLAGANVLFVATDGKASGAGRTDATGSYRIQSQWGAGLPVGEYFVAVTKFEDTGPIEEEGPYNPEAANVEAPPPKPLVPQKYAVPEKSGLKASVRPDTNRFDFDLTD
ncbi:carboxypeptidase-like regulatory domain-containing protein [Thermogutta sp.]|uniref:carboxypeptidase-like regulatory domain-containing protein n=1 Tax=Thermogutta sp. TaxID=1962930 RepID=UPI0032203DC4